MKLIKIIAFEISWFYKWEIHHRLERVHLTGLKQRNLCKRKGCFNPKQASECGFLYAICEQHSEETPKFNTLNHPETKEGICENHDYYDGDLPIIQDLELVLPFNEDMNEYNQKSPTYFCKRCLEACTY